jgi:hypothetical protein
VDQQAVIEGTRRWIASMVIGLDLCPFARRVFDGDTIRYVVSDAQGKEPLLKDLGGELESLLFSPVGSVETTLLIHPHVLQDFLDYNDFLDVGDQLVDALGLRGVIQIASFHPDYQFAGTDPDAVENYSNRSPYPMLHLLREASIAAIATDPTELLEIPRRNMKTLRGLGKEQILDRLKAIEDTQ